MKYIKQSNRSLVVDYICQHRLHENTVSDVHLHYDISKKKMEIFICIFIMMQ